MISPHVRRCRRLLPVDPPRPFLRLDVDIIVIDINLGNLHLEVVGKEPDGFPHRAEAGTPRRLEQRGRRGGRAWGDKKGVEILLFLYVTSQQLSSLREKCNARLICANLTVNLSSN